MTTTESPPTETDCPEQPPYPLYDTDFLKARIAKIPDDRKADLAEAWTWNGWPALEGLLDAETYHRYEKAVANFEATAPESFAGDLQRFHEQLVEMPSHIRDACVEALKVYAGIDNPGRWLLTSTGRFAECQRIIGEAVAYAESVADAPSVADLPPVDDTAEQVASDTYPGNKADTKTVLAWVGEDRNRAARAYAHEQERSTIRKGVIAKLEAVLGYGLDAVKDALAAAQPPPLDLAAGSPQAPAAQTDAAGTETRPSEASPGVSAPVVEAAPAASTPRLETHLLVADALDQIAAGIVALAYAVREGE